MAVKPIPDGYRTLTPHLTFADTKAAIAFYKSAFDAVELLRVDTPDGGIMHAQIKIGDSIIMMGDEMPMMNNKSPKTLGGSPTTFYFYAENCDQAIEKAVAAGGKLTSPVQDHFYGDRGGGITDPFGYLWFVASRVELLSPEQIRERMKTMMGKG